MRSPQQTLPSSSVSFVPPGLGWSCHRAIAGCREAPCAFLWGLTPCLSSEVPSLLYPNPHLKICLLNPPQPPERDHNHLGGVAEAFPSLSVRQNDLGGSSPFSHRASLTDLTRLFSEGQKALPQHLRLLQPAWHEAVRALDAFLWESTAQSCFGRKAPTLLQDLGGWKEPEAVISYFSLGRGLAAQQRPCLEGT